MFTRLKNILQSRLSYSWSSCGGSIASSTLSPSSLLLIQELPRDFYILLFSERSGQNFATIKSCPRPSVIFSIWFGSTFCFEASWFGQLSGVVANFTWRPPYWLVGFLFLFACRTELLIDKKISAARQQQQQQKKEFRYLLENCIDSTRLFCLFHPMTRKTRFGIALFLFFITFLIPANQPTNQPSSYSFIHFSRHLITTCLCFKMAEKIKR